MTQTVRLFGRFVDSPCETLDLLCNLAVLSIPPPHRKVEAGGEFQISLKPTAIVLYGVTAESFYAFDKGSWTHIEWSIVQEGSARDMQIVSTTREGPLGRDLRVIVR